MKINENTKMTLTMKQLKKLLKESKVNEGPGAGYTVKMSDITLKSAKATLTDTSTRHVPGHKKWDVTGQCTFTGYAEGYDWCTDEIEYTGEFQLELSDGQITRYIEKHLPDWEPGDEDYHKELLERVNAYSISDIEDMIGRGWFHVKWGGVLEVMNAGFDFNDRYTNDEDGLFDIELYEMGEGSRDEVNACYFCISCDEFAQDVEAAYQDKDTGYDGEEDDSTVDESARRSISDDPYTKVDRYLDEWVDFQCGDYLSDADFTDFTFFVDKKTGTAAYSEYKEKMPYDEFYPLFEEWMKKRGTPLEEGIEVKEDMLPILAKRAKDNVDEIEKALSSVDPKQFDQGDVSDRNWKDAISAVSDRLEFVRQNRQKAEGAPNYQAEKAWDRAWRNSWHEVRLASEYIRHLVGKDHPLAIRMREVMDSISVPDKPFSLFK